MSPINSPSDDTKLDHLFDDYRMMQINRFCISNKPIRKLNTCLSKLGVKALKERAMFLGLFHLEFEKKAVLVRDLLAFYLVAGNVEELVSWATDEEKDLLKQLVDAPQMRVEPVVLCEMFLTVRYLMTIGLIQIFEQDGVYVLTLQDEVKDVLMGLDWQKVSKVSMLNDEVIQYCRAVVSLYGAVSLAQLYEIYRYYKEDEAPIKEKLFRERVNNSQVRFQPYWSDDQYLYADYFDMDDLGEDLLSDILGSNKPYYMPERTEFFNYADLGYEKVNERLDALMQFLRKFGKLSENRWADLRSAILYSVAFGRLQDTIDELDDADVHFNSSQDLDQFMKLYMATSNNTRLWVNRGHTPDEIRNLHAPAVRYADVASTKVGRNAPCPCGSGKKYKKCCGGH